MYNKKIILQCLVKYWILFALVFVLQKPYWTSDVSAERRLVQIKSRILQNTVELLFVYIQWIPNVKMSTQPSITKMVFKMITV